MATIDPDVLVEAERLWELASSDGVVVRLLGGVAIRLRSPVEPPPVFNRDYPDLDFVTTRKGSGEAQRFFARAGYTPQVAFNALNSQERLLFFDDANDRQLDVFVGQFRMCHAIPLEGRLTVDERTIPLAELLLTKLQVVELNEKDVRDALFLLHEHEVGDADGETVNADRIATLLSEDWGLWRTITTNVAFCYERCEALELPERETAEICRRIDILRERIEAAPKSRGWRLRAKIGERKRWYELPEEVRR